jgi:hypothetical protein
MMAFTNFSKQNIKERIGAVAKTVTMKMERNYTVASTLGHMITFKKGVPMEVPEVMVRTCAEAGAVSVNGVDPFQEPEREGPYQPIDPGQRLNDVRKAIEKIVTANERDDFTAAGTPSVGAVSREAGYRIDRAEVQRVWQLRNEELAANATQ